MRTDRSDDGGAPSPANCGEGGPVKVAGVGPDLEGVVTILEDAETRRDLLETAEPLEFDEKRLIVTLGRRQVDVEQLACKLRVNAKRKLTVATSRDDEAPLRLPHDAAMQGIIYVAKKNPFSSVREFLEGLRERPITYGSIERVAREGLHVTSALDVELLKKSAIGAVARAMAPGCKVDTVMVLQGPQGLQKSSFFRVLVGEANFVDTVMDLDGKDAFLQLHFAWVYEWSELDALRGKELTRVKSFITSQQDTFRAPYDRAVGPHPRTTVICGTTNSDGFLLDSTGNRRFWPVRITQRIDLALVAELRENFWREALAEYELGAEWWFRDDSAFQVELETVRGEFVHVDSWTEPVSRFLEITTELVTVRGLLRAVLGRVDGDIKRPDEMRMADVLRDLGWVKGKRRTVDGARVIPWERCGSEVRQ